jgi:twitching motility protein PilT
VAAYEVLMGTDAVRNLMREGKSRQLRNVVATGAAEGMQTIEMDLARLVTAGLITMETAKSISAFPSEIQAQVSTLRSQAQAAATVSSGQLATDGANTAPKAPDPSELPEPEPEREPAGMFGRRRR